MSVFRMLTLLTLLLSAPFAHSAEPITSRELSPKLISQLRAAGKLNAQDRATQNAVTNNEIKSLVLNAGIVRGLDGHFSHKIDFKGITNQKSSGRCWLFAGLNTMRPKVIRERKLPSFTFSTAYLQFWDKMEKSNLFLERMIDLRDRDFLDREWETVHRWSLGDGGWWNYVVALIDKYGAVPADVMPETHSSENTGTMNLVLKQMLTVDAVKLHKLHAEGKSVDQLRRYKTDALARVYRFLVINLGEPPQEFEWRYEIKPEKISGDDKKIDAPKSKLSKRVRYTPKRFYDEFVGVRLSDYVTLYHDPVSETMKHYRFRGARNIVGRDEMHFVNVPIETLKTVAMTSVLADEPVWFACDVGKDHSRKHGIMAMQLLDYGPLFGVDLKMTKSERIRYRRGGSNHAMVFMGVDVRDGRPQKWLVENSWGEKAGKNGLWTLHNDWFDQHVYTIIVNHRHVPKAVMKVYAQKSKELPLWYPGAAGVE
jgi:bleomycin hydrolase